MLITHYGLPLVAVLIFAGEIGIPTLVPGEVGLLLAGNQFVRSVWMLLLAILVFGCIDLVATSTIHLAARTGGNRMLRAFLLRVCGNRRSPEAMVESYRSKLGGRDSLVVFCTRMIPMFRLYASIGTGLVRVEYKKFLAGAAPAAWIWASIPLTVGFILRSQVGPVITQYSSVTSWVIPASVAVTAAVLFLGWHRGRSLTPARALAPVRTHRR